MQTGYRPFTGVPPVHIRHAGLRPGPSRTGRGRCPFAGFSCARPSSTSSGAARKERDSNPRGGVNPLHGFQPCAFDRSAILPYGPAESREVSYCPDRTLWHLQANAEAWRFTLCSVRGGGRHRLRHQAYTRLQVSSRQSGAAKDHRSFHMRPHQRSLRPDSN